ncbi:fructose-bisphosphatase class II [Longibacter salinarum]|uniref:Fructose-1,6-bisphosphatase n=1 Tax=Longibacter salinarum TaxID=1850348 RepID=A0A2A8D2V5_9BACT|nr:class II fructose-bisphosphatase [Longibacter salinarum]PEN15292.1 fructose-bisphosphatase class II [Longibacter salinarum]
MDTRNLGLDLVRITEAAAIAAGRHMGFGDAIRPDGDATTAMRRELNTLPVDGRIVLGEHRELKSDRMLRHGDAVGTGHGDAVDLVVDPVDGRNLLARGLPGAISVIAAAPRGSMWAPERAVYMEKLVVDRHAASAIVPECLDAPAAWTLSLLARVKEKAVRDLVIFVLDRPRHADLIDEIRAAGARVMLQAEGDVAGALLAASPRHPGVDALMDIGGIPEGVIAACAVRALGGAMLGRLAPQSQKERSDLRTSGLDESAILTASDLVSGTDLYFSATGVTDGPVLRGVHYHGQRAETHSLVLRAETRTRRTIQAEHLLDENADPTWLGHDTN